MSREDFEMYDVLREERRERRRSATEVAAEDFPRRQEEARVCGYTLEASNEHHWLLRKNGKIVAQYWPSAGKWQQPKGRVKKGDWSKFAEHMVRRNF